MNFDCVYASIKLSQPFFLEMLYRSSVGIMVLSNSFASSQSFLDHLVAITEHWKAKDFVIIPVYFKISLSDICRLENRFEKVYLQYLNSPLPDRVQKWKAAMAGIASINGHEWKKETEFMLAEEVVRNACSRLYLNNNKNLDRILVLLNHSQPTTDAEIVGIWGMAGIGKTTVAREVFNILTPQYDLCYFLQDFYLMGQMKGLRQMRDDFYSKVFEEEKQSIGACDVKPSFMRDRFHKKTILVVLDDVDNAKDAEIVVGGFGWFSDGHRIILTSRRKQILIQCKVRKPYEIQKLNEFESFRLCKQYLIKGSVVISELISCSSGIPLALNVLGSAVSKQHINNMKSHLESLRRNPPTQIQEAFRRSFDGLDENEKNIFLDLACFFKGENKDYVVQLLDGCGFFTYLGICELIDESLISLLENRIEIPIPFQDMGRFIVHEEDEDPCERSRLWDSKDIADVLTNSSGTEAIESIFLDAAGLTCELSPTEFDKMSKLRLLKFYCSTSGNQCKLTLLQGLDTLPDELSLLHWENYPLQYLPQKYNPVNLVEVNMPYSNMEKLWEGKKNLKKLRKIKLSHSRYLTDILTLSEAMNLEHIDLAGCTSLVDISTSIARCAKLVSLNMKGCSHLRILSTMVDLTSLKLLNLSGCSQLEEIQDLAPNLKELYLAGTPIRELPLSIENLTDLFTLDLENCTNLQKLPFGISNSISIFELKLSGCTSLEILPKIDASDSGLS
ncbi:PREDICTED: probable WRKY transcription factor 19 [Camelina sativa]|uniref:Probable WRKY transcription factor 19 n=1 Tax=Camelina sativa TaxID=90675 RepID=A0ABM0U678_CAMSA|nr:PREDICTED: probable WRKY transcription factor 19 [Camelina sativa]